MAKIREKDRTAILNAIAGGVTPRQGIQHIQVGRLEETAAILDDIAHVKEGGGAVRVIQASYGSGKALVDSTLIDTDKGAKPIGEIEPGDMVLGTDGGYHRVMGVYPRGMLPMWTVTTEDGRVAECSPDHLWTVKDDLSGSMITVNTVQAKELLGEQGRLKLPAVEGQVPKAVISIEPPSTSEKMTCIQVDADDSLFVLSNGIVTHNTFFLTLSKTVALKQNMLVMSADLSPDRRLYASDGKAQNLYRELVRSLSSPMRPDGGALEELLEALDAKADASGREFLDEIRKLPYGYDAITVMNKWRISKDPITDREKRDAPLLQDACLRWFAGENTVEHKKMLGVKTSIGDDGAWDALKLVAMMAHFAGYAGLLVELDECVNLYKINNATSRDRNYEQVLRIFNECLQGNARYVGVLFSSTPEGVMDPRRGFYSYEALKSRLESSEYASRSDKLDTSGPVIDLKGLSQEDLLVLLGNLTNVEALGNRDEWLLDNEQMTEFLRQQYNELGADYYKTPRETNRAYVMLLRLLRNDPDMTFEKAMGNVDTGENRRSSGLGAALDTAKPNNSLINAADVDDDDFGF